MKLTLSAAALCALTLAAGCATSTAAPAASAKADETYRIVEADARITMSSSRIDSFTAGPDRSLLILTRGGGIYRVMLQPPCRAEANFAEHIALDDGSLDSFDKFSKLRVNGRTCSIASIDRVERVKPS